MIHLFTKYYQTATFFLVVVLFFIGVTLRFTHRDECRPFVLFGTDSYRALRQANIIVEQGRLPTRDMERWLPEGRDLRTHANTSAYVMAYLYRAAHWILPQTTLYDVAKYYSIICFAGSVLIFYLIALEFAEGVFAFFAVVFYLFFPILIQRSSVGFCDRDAFCLLLMLVCLYCLMLAVRYAGLRGFLLRLVLGSTLGVLALAWPGTVPFAGLLIVFQMMEVVELGRLTKATKQRHSLWEYCGYLFSMYPLLLFGTDMYLHKLNQAIPIALTMWVPIFAFTFLIIVLEILQLAGRTGFLSTTFGKIQLLAVAFLIGGFLGVWLWGQGDTVTSLYHNILSPLGTNPVIADITEMRDVQYKYYQTYFQIFLVVYLLGLLLLLYDNMRKVNQSYWFAMFALLVFLVSVVCSNLAIVNKLYPVLLPAATGVFCFCLLHQWSRTKSHQQHAFLFLLFSILMLVLTRGAVRFAFFLLPSVALASAYVMWKLHNWAEIPVYYFPFFALIVVLLQPIFLCPSLMIYFTILVVVYALVLLFCLRHYKRIPVMIFALLAVLVLLEGPVIGVGRGIRNQVKRASLRNDKIEQDALEWMRDNTPKNSVIHSLWEVGSKINVVAQRKTIIDEDLWRYYWIYLAYRHVLFAKSEQEALEFLLTRGVTHLYLPRFTLRGLKSAGRIASDVYCNREFTITHTWVKIKKSTKGLQKRIFLNSGHFSNGKIPVLLANMTGELLTPEAYQIHMLIHKGRKMRFQHVFINGSEISQTNNGALEVLPYGLFGFIKPGMQGVDAEFFLVPVVAMDTLVVRMLLMDDSELRFFKKVYTTPVALEPLHINRAQVWSVFYPTNLDLVERPEQLLPDFPDPKLRRAWYYGN